MIYLTGRILLNDESDHEDPCAALNMPAIKTPVFDSDGEEEVGY